MLRSLVFAICLLSSSVCAQDSYRVATFNVGLGRDGPGLLLKDIQSKDTDILALVAIIAEVAPDILLLTNFDNDYRQLAAKEFLSLIAEQTGLEYPYFFADDGNSGVPSGFDLNGNGHLDDWADNWGFGFFPGHESMLLISKFPIDQSKSQTNPEFLWRELPNAPAPVNPDGSDFLAPDAWENFRLASKNFWDVLVELPQDQEVHIFASHATPPVFDGEENLNGLRNNAEVAYWEYYLGSQAAPDDAVFVILADFNADPADGAGLGIAINVLLSNARISDVEPSSPGSIYAATHQLGVNQNQLGNRATDTADWSDDEIGNLRVDYVLPSSNQTVLGSGVFWPEEHDDLFELVEAAGTAHRLVWVDIALR